MLDQWELGETWISLVAQRENTIYSVQCSDASRYALRIRRVGYRSDAMIDSELDWMVMLAREGLRVPSPITTLKGQRVVRVGKHRADLVTWLDGQPIGTSNKPLSLKDASGIFRILGRTAAQLHLLSDQWVPPVGFVRPRWDADALVGEQPLWGRFWDCPGLTSSDAELFTQLRNAARVNMSNTNESLDIGLIHADLVGENVLLDSNDPSRVALIDFDDGAVGYRVFEIATALGKNVDDPQYLTIRAALIDGYQELRPLDTSQLDMFMAVRAATYVGWSAERLDEPGGAARAERALRATRRATAVWLDSYNR